MESPKYLIIITLLDGQNFSVPPGAPERIEASVFAEANFGNESILKSDPIKLINSDPEFVTELAWQLDKKSLHQLRVERKAIKLQVFMQTREKRKKSSRQNDQERTNGFQPIDSSSSTHKVELIGYTVLDIRSAQERDQPKFQWKPLLNPKFKKSSYNRPEVQLALTLSRMDKEDANQTEEQQLVPSTSSPTRSERVIDCIDLTSSDHETTEPESINDSNFYKTCLDFTLNNSTQVEQDEILDNDINIISKHGCFYIYDTRSPSKSTLNDCDEEFQITVNIPFISNLDSLVTEAREKYYFSVSLFGSSLKTQLFEELTSVEIKEVKFIVFTTHSRVLATYFELNSNLVIKLHDISSEPLGITTIQLDQLCSLDSMRRSIEGIFALQSMTDHEIPCSIHPSIGVSVILEKIQANNDGTNEQPEPEVKLTSANHIEMARQHFGDDIGDYLYKTLNDTHQLTVEESRFDNDIISISSHHDDIDMNDEEAHHFCFSIDLKNFSYTSSQRLIPTLRELVVRYSYPFFGYNDTITTDASMPISQTSSIIVSGFCEFNFETSVNSLLTALREITLDLEILTCEHSKRIEANTSQTEQLVGTCTLNLAQVLCLSEENINQLREKAVSTTVSAPIFGLNDIEIGLLQIYLCLRDCGRRTQSSKPSIENENCADTVRERPIPQSEVQFDNKRFDEFLSQAKSNLEAWKEEYCSKFAEEARKRENERFKRLYQRFEVKEANREQEFRKKMDELSNLERRLKNSVVQVESLERRLSSAFEQLKTKDAMFDTKLETIDLKISKAINDVRLEERGNHVPGKFHRLDEDNQFETRNLTRVTAKPTMDAAQLRRSSLKNSNDVTAGIPLPVRSSSLVRGPIEGTSTRLVKRPTNVTTTVVNGFSVRPRSNSTRITISRETQQKLASLRKEKAELLKRGCQPNDELMQEINSLMEKLAC